MPNNIVDVPFLNPIRFVPVSPTIINFDSLLFKNTIADYETEVNHFQTWIYGDPIRLQVRSNFAPITLEMLTCSGKSVNTYNFQVKATKIIDSDLVVYECSLSIPVVDEGQYYFKLSVGSDATLETFISEPQYIKSTAPGTMLYSYSHTFDNFDVAFQTGIIFYFRCDSSIKKLSPQSKVSVWVDQPQNLKVIDAIPTRVFKWSVGGKWGAPDWLIDKINRIACCNKMFADGTQYTVEEGAKWEPIEAEFYPLRGWKVDVRPTQNRFSLRAQNSNSPAEQFAVIYNIESKVFGTFNDNASNNIIQVTKAE